MKKPQGIPHKHQLKMAEVIRQVALTFRAGVKQVPEEYRDVLRATVAAGIVSAAIHDATEPDRIIKFINDTLTTAPWLVGGDD